MSETLPVRPDPSEVSSLAREMASAYLSMADYYRDKLKQTPEQADASARNPGDEAWRQHLVECPPDQVDWWGLSTLAEHDPEAAYRCWERVKAEARAELASGHRAAKALDFDSRPWERVRLRKGQRSSRGW